MPRGPYTSPKTLLPQERWESSRRSWAALVGPGQVGRTRAGHGGCSPGKARGSPQCPQLTGEPSAGLLQSGTSPQLESHSHNPQALVVKISPLASQSSKVGQ